jgi:hypothetical protein
LAIGEYGYITAWQGGYGITVTNMRTAIREYGAYSYCISLYSYRL